MIYITKSLKKNNPFFSPLKQNDSKFICQTFKIELKDVHKNKLSWMKKERKKHVDANWQTRHSFGLH